MKTCSDVAAQTCKRFCVCLTMVSSSGHSCSVADNIFFCCWDMLFFPIFSLVCTEVGHTHFFKWPWLCLRSDNRVMAEQAEPSGFCAYVGIKNQIVPKGNGKRSRRQIWNGFVRIAVMIEARPAGLSQMKEVSMVVRGTDDNSNYWWDKWHPAQ